MNEALVKICGLTRVEEALWATDLGADLLGLNFYRKSPRYLEIAQAKRIADAVRGKTLIVGVFVDSDRERIEEIDEMVGLDLIQFHGDESDDLVQVFGKRALKAFRLTDDDDLPNLDSLPDTWGFLFDRGGDARYGGTGEAWRYDRLAALGTSRKVLVAGGLHPGNARACLQSSGMHGIDVCSGVELSLGRKDLRLLKRLFEEVRNGEAPSPA